MKMVPLVALFASVSLPGTGNAPPPRNIAVPDDAAILARFEELVSVDIPCGQLAAERGHSKDVRAFALILVREHGIARQMVRDLTAQMQVTLKPITESARRTEHERVQAGLRDRPDAAFDVLFVRHEVDYHKEIADLLNKQWIPAAQNEDLRAFLAQVASAFESHSKMADALWQQVAPKR